MISQSDIERIDEQIQLLKQAALALSDMAKEFPAIRRNAVRILSSVKMMEINVSGVIGLDEKVGIVQR